MIMQLTKKWTERFQRCAAEGKNEWTYVELAELFNIAQANVAQKFKTISEEEPRAITEVQQPAEIRYKVFRLDYDILLSEEELQSADEIDDPEFPEWMSRATFDAIQDRLDYPDNYRFEYATDAEWLRQYQRGRIVVTVWEIGQKYPEEYQPIFLTDNCIVVN